MSEELQRAMMRPLDGGGIEFEDYPIVLGPDGRQHDRAWLAAWFGVDVPVTRAVEDPRTPYIVVCTELRCHDGPATQMVTVHGLDGGPLPNAAVARWWADAPELDPFPPDCEASRWRERAIIGWTKEDGTVGFGMGPGDKPGSSAVWVLHCDAPCDLVDKLGWAPGVAHKIIEAVFEVFETDEEPPQPPADDWREVLEQWAGLYQTAASDLAAAWLAVLPARQ